MPELPEVEVVRQGLAPRLTGRRFLRIVRGEKSLRRQSSVRDLRKWLIGRKLTDLSRRGKYLVFGLEGGVTLLVHLGMTGHLLLAAEANPFPPLEHIHLIFHLEGGLELIYQDMRRFGQVLVFPPGIAPLPLENLGREPLSPETTAQWLADQARGRSRPIKNFLLDGRILTGIGNIYACEILFAAGIHPATPVGRLVAEDWDRILTETRRILKEAIRQGGTTVANYLNSRGEAGLFQVQLLVYGKAGEPCRRCGASLARLVQAGRSTFFCPVCQPLAD